MFTILSLFVIFTITHAEEETATPTTTTNLSFRKYILVDGINSDLSNAITTADQATEEAKKDNVLIEDPHVKLFIPVTNYTTSNSYQTQLPCTFGNVVQGASSACAREILLDNSFDKSFHLTSLIARDLLDDAKSTVNRYHAKRSLTASNFDELNNLLRGLVLGLPTQSIAVQIWPSTLKITLTSLFCGGLSMSDFTVNARKESQSEILVAISITGLSVSCSANYNYQWGWFSGSGSVSVDGDSSSLTTSIAFESPDGTSLKTHSPSTSQVQGCASNVDLDSIHMRGGIVASIANFFKGTIKNKISEEINPVLCDQLKDLGASLLTSAMTNLTASIAPYLPGGALDQNDVANNSPPLQLEQSYSSKEQEALLSFSGSFEKITDRTTTSTSSINSNKANRFVSSIVVNGLTTLDEMMGGSVRDTKGRMDLGINHLVRDLFPGGIVHLNLTEFNMDTPIYDASDPLTHTTIKITNVKVTGLDSFTSFHPLLLLGNRTFTTELALAGPLEVIVTLNMNIGPTTNIFDGGATSILADHSGKTVSETITLKFSLTELFFKAASYVGISSKDFFGLRLGSAWNQPLACAISTVARFELTNALAKIGDVQEPILNGFISSGFDKLFSDLVHAIFLMYEDTLSLALPSYISSSVRPSINDMVHQYTNDVKTEGKCIPPEVSPGDNHMFNFQTNPFWTYLQDLFDQYATPEMVNILVSNFTYMQSGVPGSIHVPMPTMNSLLGVLPQVVVETDDTDETDEIKEKILDCYENPYEVGCPGTIDLAEMFGEITFRAGDLNIQNLNTVHNLQLINPSAPYILDNNIAVGYADQPLTGSINMFFGMEKGQIEMQNNFTITAGVSELNLFVQMLARLDFGAIQHLQLAELPSIDCWIATMDEFGLPKVALAVGSVFADLECVSCSSPGIRELSKTLQTDEAKQDLTTGINKIFNHTIGILQHEDTTKKVNKWVNGANARCYDWMHNTNTSEMKIEQEATLAAERKTKSLQATVAQGEELDAMTLGSAVAVVFILAGMCVCCRKSMRHQKNMVNLQKKIDVQDRIQKRSSKTKTSPLISTSKALWHSDVIPLFVRILIPFLLVTNIGFFMSGHISQGAVIRIVADVAGERVIIPDFVTFSLAQSTIDMWYAGAKGLAVIIVLFSGVWPYTKILLSLFLWFASPTTYSPSSRGAAFQWLDALGKWSMIDIFVLVLSMIGFHLKIISPALSMLPKNFYAVELQVIPMWGMYANLLAQVLSQFISHAVIYYHRNVVAAAEAVSGSRLGSNPKIILDDINKLKPNMIDVSSRLTAKPRRRASTWLDSTANIEGPRKDLVNKKERLMQHIYEVTSMNEPLRLQIAPCGQYLVIFLLLLGPVVLFYGGTEVSFSMETHGLAGMAIEMGKEGESTMTYSIFQVFTALWYQADPDYISSIMGVRFLALLFLICAIVVPFLQLFFLSILWVFNLTLRQQKLVFIVNETLSAWQYLEVYLIAIVVATLQISLIAGFMVGDVCDSFGDTFKLLVDVGLIQQKDVGCFGMNSYVKDGTYILLGAAVVLNFLCQLITRASASAIEDRENRLRGDVRKLTKEKQNKKFFTVFVRMLWMMCCCLRYVREESDDNDEDNQDDNLDNDIADVENPMRNGTRISIAARRQRNRTRSRTRTRSHSSTLTRPVYEPAVQQNGLLANWEEISTEEGVVWFWNSITGASTRLRPEAPKPLPYGWEEIFTEDGLDVYYHNVETGVTQWLEPEPWKIVTKPGPPPRRKPGPTKKSVKLMVTAYNKSQRQGSSPKPTKKNVKSMITAYDKSQRRGSSLEAITEVADDT